MGDTELFKTEAERGATLTALPPERYLPPPSNEGA